MIIIGTRKSPLAMRQTEEVLEKLKVLFPKESFTIRGISTKGDKTVDKPLRSFGGKGIFLKELEECLLNGEIDMAVHSAKDMPTELPNGLEIGAVLKRLDERDCIISPFSKIPQNPIIGTGSVRRAIQIKEKYPDSTIKEIRGNINTRIQKLRNQEYDAIMIAAAAIARMEQSLFDGLTITYLDSQEFIPAAGQGILAVEVKSGRMKSYLEAIHDKKAEQILTEERMFLLTTGGGCHAPAGAFARYENEEIILTGMYGDEKKRIRKTMTGKDCGKRTAIAILKEYQNG